MGLFSFLFGKKDSHKTDNNEEALQDYDWSDSWEGAYWRDYDYKIINKNVEILYVDMNKKQTKRKFRVEKWWCDDSINEYYIQGYCYLRKENRTFRTSRIKELLDLETGEIFQNDINEVFERYYEESDFYIYETFLDWYEDEILVLLYLSKLDGRFTKKEKDVISNLVLSECDPNRLDSVKLIFEKERFDYGDTEVSQPQAIKAIKNIKNKGDKNVNRLAEAVTELFSATKKKNPVAEAGVNLVLEKLGVSQ